MVSLGILYLWGNTYGLSDSLQICDHEAVIMMTFQPQCRS